MNNDYDVVIAGAGAAGCILAARLAEHGKNPRTGQPLRIAMMEAGPYLGQGENRPGVGHPTRRQANTFLNYEMGSRYLWPSGMAKVVGGSTMHWGTYGVTSSVFFDDDYSAWRDCTGVDWTKGDFADAVKETQELWNLKPAPEEVLTRGNKLFIDAGRALNLPVERFAVARKNCLFCGRCGAGHFCKYDAKSSSQHNIDRALQLGVEIIPECEVEKVVFEKNGARPAARGLQVRRNGNVEVIRGSKVIVSCGIIGTPSLLLRSGYGASDKVTAPRVAENVNVGRNFESDSLVPVAAIWDEPIKSGTGSSTGASYIRQDYGNNGEGRLIMQDYQMSALTYPHEAALSVFAPAFGGEHEQYMRTATQRIGGLYPFIGKTGVLGEVSATGSVTVDQNQPSVARLLKWREQATALCHEVLTKMGATMVDTPARQTYIGMSNTHAAGTCRAGEDPKTSVINSNFESHDIDDLLICDASAVPRQQQYGAMSTVTVAHYAWRRIVRRHFA